ncbi:solute carrier family 22 member 2 isoform 2-T2 [Anomaloglossus baeobatrachus]|uniref:solute carrier family 22 member 2 isoform X2 n=1 Tax=Anomaloglossus baeobatrachus TaxID=238106 RepID=UPI003F50ADDF
MTTFDDILEDIGQFGLFQKQLFFSMCFVSAVFTPIYVGIVFLGFVPQFRCSNPVVEELKNKCGWSFEEELNFTVLWLNESTQNSQCHQYDIDWNKTSLICADPLRNLTKSGDRNISLTSCTNGWVYDTTGSSIVTEFNLVCDDAWKLDLFQSFVNLGFFLGSIFIGYIADRFGRKPCLFISLFISAIFGVLVAFAPTYPWLVTFRFIQGLVSKGTWLSAYVLVAEFVGLDHRRTVGIVYQVAFTVGLLALAGMAYVITNWRWLQLAVTLPNFLFLTYYWWVPESPRWLISQNRKTEANAIINKIAKRNKKVVPYTIQSLMEKEEMGEKRVPSFADLVRTPQIRKYTFILMYIWNLGIMVCSSFCDLGGTITPFLVYRLANIWKELPLIVFAVIGIISGILVLFLPETKGRALPETIEDAENLHRKEESTKFNITYLEVKSKD